MVSETDSSPEKDVDNADYYLEKELEVIFVGNQFEEESCLQLDDEDDDNDNEEWDDFYVDGDYDNEDDEDLYEYEEDSNTGN